MRILRDLSYTKAGGVHLLLDLHVPDGNGPFPVVVWIHGGGWTIYDRTKIDDPQYLLDAGFVVAAIDYRLTTVAPFPAMIADCQAAVRWLREHHQRYGLRAGRIGAMGPSAGGHLAALLALTPHIAWDGANHAQSAAVHAVVPVCPVTDVEAIWPYWVQERHDVPELTKMIHGFCGGNPAERIELMRQASPLSHVAAGAPPFSLFHGDADPTVPISHSERLAAALHAHGVATELTVSSGTGHVGIDGYPQPEAARAAISSFFARHLMQASI
jgi:acetyl esterase/lipase